jgi:hypothetical protein
MSNGNGQPQPDEAAVQRELERLRIRSEAKRRYNAEQIVPAEIPPLRSLAERRLDPTPNPGMRIDRVMIDGGRVTFSGPPKGGKTTAKGEVTRSLADGVPLFGEFDTRPLGNEETVALYAMEMSEGQQERWLLEAGIINEEKVLLMALRGRVAAFNPLDPDNADKHVQLLHDHNTKVWIIDPVQDLFASGALDINRNDAVLQMLTAIDGIAERAAIENIIIGHHHGHGAERAMNSAAFRAWPDAEWNLVTANDGRRYFSATGRDINVPERLDINVPERLLTFDPATRHLTLTGGSRKDAAADSALTDVLALLANTTEPLTCRAIERGLADSQHTQKAIRDATALGVSRGDITRENGRRNSYLHTLSASVRGSALPLRQHGESERVSAYIENAHTLTPQQSLSASAVDPSAEATQNLMDADLLPAATNEPRPGKPS